MDITKVVSTPSLSLLIYRHKFQELEIPILKRNLDNVIRESYFGGSSDYYKLHGINLKYYDINSLYPYAMLNDMPLEYLGESNTKDLNEIFGFVECIITCPDNIKVPLLIHREEGKVIHPVGTWKGIYFSEELKAVINYGYKVEILKCYQFTRGNLFTNYVNHFYDKKKNSIGAERFIAKLQLNTLYGMFGRKLDMVNTIPVTKHNLWNILSKYAVKSKISINDRLDLFLTYNNLDFSIINKMRTELDYKTICNLYIYTILYSWFLYL